MQRGIGIELGALVGALIGGLVLIRSVVRGGHTAPFGCPAGWHSAPPIAAPGASVLAACEPTPADSHATGAYFAVYQLSADASDAATQNAVARAVGNGRHLFDGPLPPGAPAASSPEGGAFAVLTRCVDRPAVPLVTDVYFVSGGRKFGLLSVVHAPAAPFATPEGTAAWLDTLQGTAPWGAPNETPFAARCPDGFEALSTDAPRSVVRCAYGPGSSWFVTLSLTWDEGDFGRQEDRARVASAIANRVANAQVQSAGAARVTVAPEPFTVARRVDALHARVETDQTAPVTAQLTVMFAPVGAPRVLAAGVAEPGVPLTATVREVFREHKLLGPRGVLDSPTRAAALAAALVVLFASLGAMVAGRRRAS